MITVGWGIWERSQRLQACEKNNTIMLRFPLLIKKGAWDKRSLVGC